MTIEDDLSKVSEIIKQSKLELKSIQVNKEIPIDIDAGNLLALDNNELDREKLKTSDFEYYMKEIARDGVQSIINEVWDLPSETMENVLYALLPKPSTRLPREKPVPKAQSLTKWEQYAKEKGITKKRKGGKVWDEVLKEWVPRYGFKRAEAERKKNWVREVPDGSDPFEDQFEKASKKKADRIAKNEFQRLRNIARSKNVKIPGVGITAENMSNNQIQLSLDQTRRSTASLGKFQEKLREDKPLESVTRGKKRKLPANDVTSSGLLNENKKSLEILNKLSRPDLKYEAAVNKQIKIDNIREAQPDKKETKSKRRSKHGKRQRGRSERRALAKGLKPVSRKELKFGTPVAFRNKEKKLTGAGSVGANKSQRKRAVKGKKSAPKGKKGKTGSTSKKGKR